MLSDGYLLTSNGSPPDLTTCSRNSLIAVLTFSPQSCRTSAASRLSSSDTRALILVSITPPVICGHNETTLDVEHIPYCREIQLLLRERDHTFQPYDFRMVPVPITVEKALKRCSKCLTKIGTAFN